MYFATVFIASLVVSASALATPRVEGLNRRHHHATLAKRVPAPVPLAEPIGASAAFPKRQLRKRCAKSRRTSSTEGTSSTKASSSEATPSPSAALVNVGAGTTSTESTTSSNPAPSSSSSKAPSSSSSKADPAPSSKPAPSSAPSGGGSQSSGLFTGTQKGGDATFYGTGLGACGITNNDSDFIAAVPLALFDSYPGYDGVNPNKNPVCNKKVEVTYEGKSVTVTVTDRCAGCNNDKSLDLSPKAFNQIADPSAGRIHGIKYTWLD